MKQEGSGDYSPLYLGGKRDKARRYISKSGNIISRREYIKISEGVTPEEKAYRRYKQGLAPRGKTVEKVEKQKKRKKKVKVGGVKEIKERDMHKELTAKGKKIKQYNTYQLQGEYKFYNPKTKQTGTSVGYSTHTKGKRSGMDFLILREQAMNYAKAQLPFSGWQLVEILWEQWLKW